MVYPARQSRQDKTYIKLNINDLPITAMKHATQFLAILMVLTMELLVQAQGYTNPVIPGFNPDPSVCRVGQDYYLVTSSFHYFPGVPLYHSRDLVNWEHIGHVLNRESQLPLPDAGSWGGIYAPTIRHHDGRFYMITTNCSYKGNFIVWTDDIYGGRWSDPYWVKVPGIDPDLFWDEDGTCYFTGCANDGIMQCRINPDTGELLSEPQMIWRGTGGRYPEAPHIYKKDGWYYLMIAEGGTEFGHGETIARSRSINGPYEPAPHNPILTHFKQKTQTNPIQGTGHADIVQAHDGSWWMVCLGFRTQGGNHHITGRETYLAPVEWNNEGWPVVNGTGDIAIEMNVPTLPQLPFKQCPEREDFNGTDFENPVVQGLGPEWSWLRNPDTSRYQVTAGLLRMYGNQYNLNEKSGSPTFIGRRQEDINFTAETQVRLRKPHSGDKAGMTVFMDSGAHYDLYIKKSYGGKWAVTVRYAMGVIDHVTEVFVNSPKVWLRITGEAEYYRFWYSTDGTEFKQIGIGNTRYLSSETAGGFTGVMVGLWAHCPDAETNAITGFADFEYFEYIGE